MDSINGQAARVKQTLTVASNTKKMKQLYMSSTSSSIYILDLICLTIHGAHKIYLLSSLILQYLSRQLTS